MPRRLPWGNQVWGVWLSNGQLGPQRIDGAYSEVDGCGNANHVETPASRSSN